MISAVFLFLAFVAFMCYNTNKVYLNGVVVT